MNTAVLEAKKPLFGCVTEGYWEDVGTHESYLKAQADVSAANPNCLRYVRKYEPRMICNRPSAPSA